MEEKAEEVSRHMWCGSTQTGVNGGRVKEDYYMNLMPDGMCAALDCCPVGRSLNQNTLGPERLPVGTSRNELGQEMLALFILD